MDGFALELYQAQLYRAKEVAQVALAHLARLLGQLIEDPIELEVIVDELLAVVKRYHASNATMLLAAIAIVMTYFELADRATEDIHRKILGPNGELRWPFGELRWNGEP